MAATSDSPIVQDRVPPGALLFPLFTRRNFNRALKFALDKIGSSNALSIIQIPSTDGPLRSTPKRVTP